MHRYNNLSIVVGFSNWYCRDGARSENLGGQVAMRRAAAARRRLLFCQNLGEGGGQRALNGVLRGHFTGNQDVAVK